MLRCLQTCTAEAVSGGPGDDFSVSETTGGQVDGAILHVRRCRWLPAGQAARLHARGTGLSMVTPRQSDGRVMVMFPADGDGRRFDDCDQASAFCLEHGYTRRYFSSPELRARRVAKARRP